MYGMNELTRAYLAIFDLVSETCRIDRVNRVGKTKNESGDNVYKYIAIVVAPMDLPDMKADENTCIKIQKFAKKQLKQLGGPDVIQQMKYAKSDGKVGKFNFACNLIPDNVMGLEIKDGVMYVTCKAYGAFF
jgi:hypothetical protein